MKYSILRIRSLLLFFFIIFIFSGCFNERFAAIKKSPDSYKNLIVQKLNEGVELKNVYMTPSKRYPGYYYVAGEIFGTHMSGVVTGIWLVDSSPTPSDPLSVNQAAIAFSHFPPADKTKKLSRLSSNKEARTLITFFAGKHYR